jgi:hypothetical protein
MPLIGASGVRFKDLYYTGRISAGGVSATGSNGIWVDSATGNVGIGVASPLSNLDIQSASGVGNTVHMRGGTYTNISFATGIKFEQPAGTTNANRQFRFTSGSTSLTIQGTDGAGSDVSDGKLLINPNGGNVGIGTDNPATLLNLSASNNSGGNNNTLRFTDTDTSTQSNQTVGKIEFYTSDATNPGVNAFIDAIAEGTGAGGSLTFGTGLGTATEAMRIDQNRNLLAGTTSTYPGSVSNIAGIHLGGATTAGRGYFSNDGGRALNLNRMSSDGEIIEFRKDAVVIGSIGVTDSDLKIYSTTSNHTGLQFANQTISPINSSGALVNDFVNLGSSTYKFKDLWISGTANLPLVDIDGGNIDGATLGANSAIVAGTFTDLTVTDTLNLPTTISPTSIVFNDASALGGDRYSNSMTFGNDSDLAIYHDGSHSYITEKGTGDLRLRGSGVRIQGNDAGNLLIANQGAEVSLYYNNAQKLVTTSTGVTVTGLLTADTKSFTIDHPTKEGMKLRYGSLEGPEHGVYVRGRLNGENTIELPEVWLGLVDENTITVNLTPIGKGECWVEDIQNNTVTVGGHLNCFYMVLAERKDVEKLEVEFPSDGS